MGSEDNKEDTKTTLFMKKRGNMHVKHRVNSSWFCCLIFQKNSTFGGHLGVIFFSISPLTSS